MNKRYWVKNGSIRNKEGEIMTQGAVARALNYFEEQLGAHELISVAAAVELMNLKTQLVAKNAGMARVISTLETYYYPTPTMNAVLMDLHCLAGEGVEHEKDHAAEEREAEGVDVGSFLQLGEK